MEYKVQQVSGIPGKNERKTNRVDENKSEKMRRATGIEGTRLPSEMKALLIGLVREWTRRYVGMGSSSRSVFADMRWTLCVPKQYNSAPECMQGLS